MEKIRNINIASVESPFDATKIKSPEDAYNLIRKFYGADIELFESAFLLCLDRDSKTTAYVKISQGGVAGTVMDTKVILYYAIKTLSSGIIIAHNHPSGNLKPSDSDVELTKRIKEACRLVDINMLDHLIITKDGYYSINS